MGKKQHAEEHENLERWLVSYADFITLLFATFVVLYALSQSDIAEFTKMQDSIRKAFAAPSLLQGSPDIMSGDGQSMMNTGASMEDQAMIPPLLEYMSQKYEQKSFESIKEELDELSESGELAGVEASIHERGLVINLKDLNLFFESATANLKKESYGSLQKIGKIIRSKFASHLIRVEGHTDNLPIKSAVYPSNWELSSSRASSIVRFLLANFKFKKERFAALGYADTKPIKSNRTEKGRQKNRRVEIVVLRNKYLKSEPEAKTFMASKLKEAVHRPEGSGSIKRSEYQVVSDAARKLAQESGVSSQNVIILRDKGDKRKEEMRRALAKFEQRREERNHKIEDQIHHGKKKDSKKNELFIHSLKNKKEEKKDNSKYKEEHKNEKEAFYKENNHERNVLESLIDGFNNSTKFLHNKDN